MHHERSFSWSAALAGLAVGLIGSRIVPPLLAQLVGTARAGADPFERLINEHRKISALIDEMESLVGEGSAAKRGRLFLNLKRTLAKHSMAEEDVVYPILFSQVHDEDRSKHLYDEHADIKIQLYEIEQCLMRGDDWTNQVRALRRIIEDHVREEEQEGFPRLRQALDEGRSKKVAGFISREEAMVL
jgi:hemerythrin superfamily protein